MKHFQPSFGLIYGDVDLFEDTADRRAMLHDLRGRNHLTGADLHGLLDALEADTREDHSQKLSDLDDLLREVQEDLNEANREVAHLELMVSRRDERAEEAGARLQEAVTLIKTIKKKSELDLVFEKVQNALILLDKPL